YLEVCRANPIPKGLFDNALRFEAGLKDTLDARRTIAISGYGIPTVVGYDDPTNLHLAEAYLVSEDGGDGVVPLELARPEAEGVREPLVRGGHAGRATDSKVLGSLPRLLTEGRTDGLSDSPPEIKPGQPATDGSSKGSRIGKPPIRRGRYYHEVVTRLPSRRD